MLGLSLSVPKTSSGLIAGTHTASQRRLPVQLLLAVRALTRQEHDYECGAIFHV